MKDFEKQKLIIMITASTLLSSVFTTFFVMKYFDYRTDDSAQVTPTQRKEYSKNESNTIDIIKKANESVVSIVISKEVPKLERVQNQMNLQDPFGMFGFGQFNNLFPQYVQNGTEEKEIGGGSGFL